MSDVRTKAVETDTDQIFRLACCNKQNMIWTVMVIFSTILKRDPTITDFPLLEYLQLISTEGSAVLANSW